jgi:hypothetical protein
MCLYTFVFVNIFMHIFIYIYTYVYTYIYIYVSIYIYIHVYTYIGVDRSSRSAGEVHSDSSTASTHLERRFHDQIQRIIIEEEPPDLVCNIDDQIIQVLTQEEPAQGSAVSLIETVGGSLSPAAVEATGSIDIYAYRYLFVYLYIYVYIYIHIYIIIYIIAYI